MRNLAILAAALSLLALFTPRAEADLGATGTRMAIAGGAARFYMTYGHVDEPEIYAPIGRELARIQVTFRRQGEDYLVFHRGALVERWPIVFTKEGVPETGEHPCVLVMCGSSRRSSVSRSRSIGKPTCSPWSPAGRPGRSRKARSR
jgi:hypothetical protein